MTALYVCLFGGRERSIECGWEEWKGWEGSASLVGDCDSRKKINKSD
jgi:hypothetical protein